PQKASAPVGEYRIELSDGDILFGSLKAITKDQIEIESKQFGNLKIARSELRRMTPTSSDAFAYRGPNNLSEWTSAKIDQWREEAGRLITNARGATVKKAIQFPEQAHIEFEISWAHFPQFTLAFASTDKEAQLKEGFRLEVWNRKLVLV